MKELLLQYANYNTLANQLMIDAMLILDEGLVDKHMVSSFPTLRITTYHCWSAEYIWLQRLENVEQPKWIQESYQGSFADACKGWQHISTALSLYISEQPNEAALQACCHFSDIKGTQHTMPIYQILHHVFNHSSYHRGQLVTMLRQAGATTIPRTDFIALAKML